MWVRVPLGVSKEMYQSVNNERADTDFQKLFSFGVFFTKLPQHNYGMCFENYYILARRGKFLVINPYALGDLCARLVTFFRQFAISTRKCSRWVFSFTTKFSMLARWFSWTTGSYVFARLSREVSLAGRGGQYLCLDGNMASYSFMNFIGVDVGFILSSRSSSGRASSLTDRGVLTIGFDGCLNPIYAYNCPGTRSTRSAVLYSRLFNLLLSSLFKR